MAEARFVVRRVGPHVSIQDAGRPGLMRFGVPCSGPLDRGAYTIADAALGNPAGTPQVEISRGGLELACISGAVTFAVAGGGFQVLLDGNALGAWSVATITTGSTLLIAPGFWGSWTYLAFAGRLETRLWLGSAATHAPSGWGGGKLGVGQELVVSEAHLRPERIGRIACPISARPRAVLRVVPGPQQRFFSHSTIETFLKGPFQLTSAHDRMGARLAGPALVPEAVLDIPSEAIVRGSVQVGGDGTATVLLADHQTTGGYPKIATVVSDDLDGFVQLRPRDRISFVAIEAETALKLARRLREHWQVYIEHVRRGRPANLSASSFQFDRNAL